MLDYQSKEANITRSKWIPQIFVCPGIKKKFLFNIPCAPSIIKCLFCCKQLLHV